MSKKLREKTINKLFEENYEEINKQISYYFDKQKVDNFQLSKSEMRHDMLVYLFEEAHRNFEYEKSSILTFSSLKLKYYRTNMLRKRNKKQYVFESSIMMTDEISRHMSEIDEIGKFEFIESIYEEALNYARKCKNEKMIKVFMEYYKEVKFNQKITAGNIRKFFNNKIQVQKSRALRIEIYQCLFYAVKEVMV